MNERIRQIRQEAWAFVKHDLETVERDHVVMYSEHLEMHYAKFAELIVKECVDCARGAGLADDVAVRNTLGFNDGIAEAVTHIKKHFGVEL